VSGPERIIVGLSWAAEQLAVSTDTARRLARVGELPGAFQVGTQWRVSVPAFLAEVERRARANHPTAQQQPPLDAPRPVVRLDEGPSLVRRRRSAS
jgi:excisionase family DNA binding protein